MNTLNDAPRPLRQRLLITTLLSPGALLLGGAVAWAAQEWTTLVFTGIVCLLILSKAIVLYRAIRQGTYGVLEGTCTAIYPRLFSKTYRVRFTDDSGKERTLLLSKRIRVSEGTRYRLYYRQDILLMLYDEYFDRPLFVDCFWGIETVTNNETP